MTEGLITTKGAAFASHTHKKNTICPRSQYNNKRKVEE